MATITVFVNWRQSTLLETGLDDMDFFRYAFADPDHDGKDDLVVGTNAQVFAYKNMSPATPQWQRWDAIFAHIDSGAAPAFSDHDQDGDLDLFVGDKKGFLHYFENQSTVGVQPREFQTASPVIQTNFPNPFNNSMRISFELPGRMDIDLHLYDCRGRRVFHQKKYCDADRQHVVIDALQLKSGVYFIQLKGP